ncbi:MAG: sugar ABC transporter permease [Thermotogae bacterium]|nr:sugar ABC transporter permease [Thermotogota bacterium]
MAKNFHRGLRIKQTIIAYIFLAIPAIILGIFTYYPMILGVVLSFFRYDFINPMKMVGFSNYAKVFGNWQFLNAMKNSFLYLLVVPPLQLLSIIMAILVNRQMKGINVFRTLYFIPVITSMTVVALSWNWMFAQKGILNYILMGLHFTSQPIGWLTDPKIALFSIMFVTMWKGLGYYMMIYLAGLQSIPFNLIEAAMIDGAKPAQVFWKITFPLLKPYVMFCSVVSTIAALNVFTEIYVMTGGGPYHSTETMGVLIYEKAFENLKFGYSSALAVILSLVLIVATMMNLKFFKEGGVQSYYG